jgi:nucleolar protein 56
MIKDFDKNREECRKACFEFTAEKLRVSVNQDNFIVQAISEINELDKLVNMLSRRLNEYVGLYLPELYGRINDNKTFARLISTKTKKELMEDIKITKTIGAEFEDEDLVPIVNLAKQIIALFELRDKTEKYLELILEKYMPNVHHMLGTTITAKLMLIAGSLRHLSLFPASTIQMLGAETALFRHLKTGARCPKYGFLFMHPLVANSKQKTRGKAARMLATKVSILTKVDYFKGEFVADKLLEQLEKKLK